MIWEHTAIKDASKVTSDQVLIWARQVEAQRTQAAVMNNFKVGKNLMQLDQKGRKTKL